MSDVTAIMVGRRAPASLARSDPSRFQDQVHAVQETESLGGIQRAATGATTPLVWLLDAGASPLEDTLRSLLEHTPGPAVSLPVDRRGAAVEDLMGRVAEDVPGILATAEQRCAPLRHTHVRSLLLERELVLQLAPPDPARFGWYAGEEWTARLFARRPGRLVPASRIVVDDWSPGSPLHVLRAARATRWGSGETARELARAARRNG